MLNSRRPSLLAAAFRAKAWSAAWEHRVRKLTTSNSKIRQTIDSDVALLLEEVGAGKSLIQAAKGTRIFSQGDTSDAIFFIEEGKVKISVVSDRGKEAVLIILSAGDFFGEGCLVGQPVRISTATTLEESTVFRIESRTMLAALANLRLLNERFIALLLVRNINLEADLCDQLFNPSERRLARVLLKLARMRSPHDTAEGVPLLSHEILAEMVGTTRSRITQFMNKFRRMGLIDYNERLIVRCELLADVVLHGASRGS